MKIRKELGTEGGDFSNSTEPNEDLLEKCWMCQCPLIFECSPFKAIAKLIINLHWM
jgi:hypothetical protein